MNRKVQRARILQLLYAREFNNGDSKIDKFEIPIEDSNLITNFIIQIVEGVIAQKEYLDKMIEQYAENWENKRLLTIDKLILRFAIFEMLFFKETPKKVVINEAIELAKKFSSEKSSSFINGILDKIFIIEMGKKNE